MARTHILLILTFLLSLASNVFEPDQLGCEVEPVDYYGFQTGYCTYYAAKEFDKLAGEPKGAGWRWRGNAGHWLTNAAKAGYETTTDPRKGKRGAIAVWSGGGFGHVAVVTGTSPTSLSISEMNWGKIVDKQSGKTDKFGIVTTATVQFSNMNRGNMVKYSFQGLILPPTPPTVDVVTRARQLIVAKRYKEVAPLLASDLANPNSISAEKLILAGFAAMASEDSVTACNHFWVLIKVLDPKNQTLRDEVAKFIYDTLRGADKRSIWGFTLGLGEGYLPGAPGERYQLAKRLVEIFPTYKDKEAVCFTKVESKEMTSKEFLRRFPNSNYRRYLNAEDLTGGATNAPEKDESSLVKYSPGGKMQWKAKFSEATKEAVWAYTEDIKGNVYVCGLGNSIVKYSPSGKLIWRANTSTGFDAHDVAVDGLSNVYIVGSQLLKSMRFAVLTQFDASGRRKLEQRFPEKNVLFDSAVGSPDGGVFISSISESHFTVKRLSQECKEIWTFRISASYPGGNWEGEADGVCSGAGGYKLSLAGGSLLYRHEVNDHSFLIRTLNPQTGKLISAQTRRATRRDFWRQRTKSKFEVLNTGRFAAG